MMLVRLYGVVAYLAFLAVFLYLIGFVSGWGVPKTVDDGVASWALAVDLGLVLSVGLVHSVMARAWFKRIWSKLVPPPAERSTYVLVASAQLALLCWQWRPVDAPELWRATGILGGALRGVLVLGWAIAVSSTYLIDHFELFGLRQAFGKGEREPVLRTPLLYRWVRHPLYFGMLLGLWSAPVMSASHGLLSSLLTVYILVGARHEERDLVRTFGDAYRSYQDAVPMLLPTSRWRPWRGRAARARGAHR